MPAAALLVRALLLMCSAPPLTRAAAQTRSPLSSATDARPVASVSTFTLPNGLRVILHLDRSDPIVAVALAVHVGSAREVPGRTGLAHLLEHLAFLAPEHVGAGGLDELSARIGGSGASGNTSRDVTVYQQSAPRDALEKLLWAQADQLGHALGGLTESMLQRERAVVLSEMRAAFDGEPFGRADAAWQAAMYGVGHPYGHVILGVESDVAALGPGDARRFHARWYVPNNATLVVAGDFDPQQVRRWVGRYFGELERGRALPRPVRASVNLGTERRIRIVDSLATSPQLVLAWPTVPATHPDAPALIVLSTLLSQGPQGPLATAMSAEGAVADVAQLGGEIAGEFVLRLRTRPGVAHDAVLASLDSALDAFARVAPGPAIVSRAAVRRERELYAVLESVEERAAFIARNDASAGDPRFADRLLSRLRRVTSEDVRRVLARYIAARPRVALSVVPPSQPSVALQGASVSDGASTAALASMAPRVGAPSTPHPGAPGPTTRRGRSARRAEPPFGPRIAARSPRVWMARLPNGVRVSGIEDHERPTLTLELSFEGGRDADVPARPGGLHVLMRMLADGTAALGKTSLGDSLASLGADLTAEAGEERAVLRCTTLARTLAATMRLLADVLEAPSLDTLALARAKTATIAELRADRADARYIARGVLETALFGPAHVRSRDPRVSEASVEALTPADVQNLRARLLDPAAARLRIVGAIAKDEALSAIGSITAAWSPPSVARRPRAERRAPSRAAIYVRDLPGAATAVLMAGSVAMPRSDPRFTAASVAVHTLGGGFTSRLVRELRTTKGYTHDVRARLEAGRDAGMIHIDATLQPEATAEAVQTVRQVLARYRDAFSSEELERARESLARRRARAFETARQKLLLLAEIDSDEAPANVVALREQRLRNVSRDEVRDVIARYLDPDAMTIVLVGNAKIIGGALRAAGLAFTEWEEVPAPPAGGA